MSNDTPSLINMDEKAAALYNERSWAIDLITEINAYSSSRSRAIARAGGEHTLSGEDTATNLFPDVLLFGDPSGNLIRHGWELKMPDD